MKSFAVISLLASLAAAAQIPTGISSGCSAYLTQLDSNSTLQSCTSSLITATGSFGPGGSGSASSSSVKGALDSLCSNTACSETTIRGTLASFYSACQPELTSSLNTNVLQIYDVLYALIPFRTATCSKDDSGTYCATEIAGTVPTASSLYTESQEVVTPNFDSLNSTNAAFLFLDPTLSTDKLCTTCTRAVLTSYISFESDIAYGPGLSNSVLLGGQSALYKAVVSGCGSSFLSGAVQAAGSLSGGLLGDSTTSGASRAVGASAGGIATLLGAVAVAVAAF